MEGINIEQLSAQTNNRIQQAGFGNPNGPAKICGAEGPMDDPM